MIIINIFNYSIIIHKRKPIYEEMEQRVNQELAKDGFYDHKR